MRCLQSGFGRCRTSAEPAGQIYLETALPASCTELTTAKHTPNDHCTSGVCFRASVFPAGRKLKVPKLCAQATGYLRLESVQRYVLLLAGHYAARGTMHNSAHLQVAK